MVALLLAACGGLGDRWWPGTLLLYTPRWPFAAPLTILVPAAVAMRRRALLPLGLASILMIGPVMNFCVPWGRIMGSNPRGTRIRIMTCNFQAGHRDVTPLETLVDSTDPDILMMQEWAAHPGALASWSKGRHVRRDGGLFLSSRYPIRGVEVLTDPASPRMAMARAPRPGDARGGLLHVFNVHLETPRKGIEPFLQEGPDGLAEFRSNISP